jgi:hypothetical protein
MRTQPGQGVWRKPRRWRRLGILFSAGTLALAGCSSLESAGTTAAAPDPFLGPYKASPPPSAIASVQPPTGSPARGNIGVLPAAPAPNSSVSVASLAPTSVHPLGDREELRIGSPRPVGGGTGWSAPGTMAIASTGGQAKLTAPEASSAQNRTAPPAVSTETTNPQPIAQPASRQVEQPAQPVAQTQPAPAPAPAPQRPEPEPRPTTIDAAYAQLNKKGAQWQPATENTETHEWIFRCAVVNSGTNKVSVYEGRDKDQLSAVLSALDDINKSQ